MYRINTISLQQVSRLFIAATFLSILSVTLLFTQAHGHVGDENPEIEVVPGSSSVEVEVGGTASETVNISNNGKDPLSWTASVANTENCADMSTASEPWLVISGDTTGTVKPGESAQLSFSVVGTMPGEYSGKLCIASNDPNNPVVEVPISMVVTGDDDGGEEPGPGEPGDRWDAVKEWLREMIKRLKELLERLG